MGVRHLLTAAGLGCVAAVVAGCGSSSSSGLLTSAQASGLKSSLATINAEVSAGQCKKARASVQSFDATVKQLPGSVNATLVGNLGRGATTLQSLTANCGAGNVTTPTSTSSSSTTSSTGTTGSGSTGAGNTGNTGNTGSGGAGVGAQARGGENQ